MRKITIPILALIGLLTSCTVMYKSARYFTPDNDEYHAFSQAEIKSGNEKFVFHTCNDTSRYNFKLKVGKEKKKVALDDYLKESTTTAFVIIRNDTIVFENYYNGFKRHEPTTFFSVTKSVTSVLVGIAVDEGAIKSVHDPVTNYIPELKEGHPYFQQLTIEHLLQMRSGIKFNESYSNPLSSMAKMYYGRNQLKQIKKLKFECEPGTKHNYLSAVTAILGIALERATGTPYAEYLEEKLWQPLGMEYDASINLDDRKNRSAKSYQGLNATAIDLAKIGRLYLNKGMWTGERILSEEWIEKCTTPYTDNRGYQYQWYSDNYLLRDTANHVIYAQDSISAINIAKEHKIEYFRTYNQKEKGWIILKYYPLYFAYGILDQELYVDPERNVIIVRLGDWWGDKNSMPPAIMRKYFPKIEKDNKQLAAKP